MMTSNILSFIQAAIGLVAICFWGVGMYYWHLTNRNLQPGVSIFVLLNPASYFHSEYFTPAGIKYRKSTIISFAVVMFFALLAFALRALSETSF